MAKVGKELKETVETHPHIKEVYFDRKGNHFFNVHKNGDKKYSRSVPEFVPKIEKKAGKDVQVGTKMAQTWLAEHEIVETLSRAEILKTSVAEEGNKKEENKK